MDIRGIVESLKWAVPEAVLAGFIVLVILGDLRRGGEKWFVPFLALSGLALAGLFCLLAWPGTPLASFQGAYRVDVLSLAFKLVFLGAAFLVAVFSIPATRAWSMGRGEYFALLLACTLGMMFMSSANDLLMMYLALEFVSISSYILAGFVRRNRNSAEASLKYIIYGAAASGLMLYGMTFLYGLTGTLQVEELGRKLAEQNLRPTMTLITGVLIMAGFGYKIAAVPFHMWCPDVYEGAPTPVTAFFSVGPKAAGFAMLIRFLHNAYPAESGFEWKLLLALLAVLTMAVGNFGALQQRNLKRLLAYSSIAHAGYLLVGLAIFTPETVAAVLFYVAVYVVMNLGAFLAVLVLEERHGVSTVEGCRGLGWRAPGLCGLLTVFLFSLTGLPPTAGFVGKVLVFVSVIQNGDRSERALPVALVVIAVFFTVISLFYYARIVASMFLRRSEEDEALSAPAPGVVYGAILWILALGTLGFGILWEPLHQATLGAARTFFAW